MSPLPQDVNRAKPKKQDAIMQTDPVQDEEEQQNTCSETSDTSYHDDTVERYQTPAVDPLENYEVHVEVHINTCHFRAKIF